MRAQRVFCEAVRYLGWVMAPSAGFVALVLCVSAVVNATSRTPEVGRSWEAGGSVKSVSVSQLPGGFHRAVSGNARVSQRAQEIMAVSAMAGSANVLASSRPDESQAGIPGAGQTAALESTRGTTTMADARGASANRGSMALGRLANPSGGWGIAVPNAAGYVRGRAAEPAMSDRSEFMFGERDYRARSIVESTTPVVFADAHLEQAVLRALGRSSGPLYPEDLVPLTSLDAKAMDIELLGGIEWCINLVELDLYDNQISDLAQLSGLTQLEYLNVGVNEVADIGPLSGLTDLLFLELGSGDANNLYYLPPNPNRIADLSPLASLTHLVYLGLADTGATDLSVLTNFAGLRILWVDDNPIAEFSPLGNLTQLAMLGLRNTGMTDTDLGYLRGLTLLQTLVVSGNAITNLDALEGFSHLRGLAAQDNPALADITAVSSLIRLELAFLGGCRISDVSPVASLRRLQGIDLRNNRITSVEPLADADFTGVTITAWGNTFTLQSLCTDVPSIRDHGNFLLCDGDCHETRTLAIQKAGTGSVTPPVGQHPQHVGDTVELLAVGTEPGWAFDHWEGGVSGTGESTTVTMNTDTVVTAVFSPADRVLDLRFEGSGSTWPPNGRHGYRDGRTAYLSAIPDAGWTFSHWDGDITGSSNTGSVTMDADKTVTAVFVPGPVDFADAQLEHSVRTAIGKPAGQIFFTDVENLMYLDASDQAIQDLSGLNWCRNLVSLNLFGNEIEDVEPLSQCEFLRSLDLGVNRVSDAGDLAGLRDLLMLELGNGNILNSQYLPPNTNTITDLSPLVNLQRLVCLGLGDSGLTDLEPVANLRGLAFLWLQDNPGIASFVPLGNLTHLLIATLMNTGIESAGLAALSGATDLVAVGLSGNAIDDISALSGCSNLQIVLLDDNPLADIGPLSGLAALTAVSLNRCGIADLEPFRHLTQLTSLDLESNLISDLEPLAGENVSGADVVAWGNTLTTQSLCTYIPAIQANGNSIEYDGACGPPYTLTIEQEGTGALTPPPGMRRFAPNRVVDLVAGSSDPHWGFDHWEGDITGGSERMQLVMDGDKSVRAVFLAAAWTLKVSVQGNGGTWPGLGPHGYVDGHTANLLAFSDQGWTFDHWEDDAAGNEPWTRITMDGPKKVRAVFVPHDPPAVTLAASPEIIFAGESSTLSWTSTDANTCTLSPGIGNVQLNGAMPVSPVSTTHYLLTGMGAGGKARARATVTVVTPPRATLSVSPASISLGGSATLAWTSTDATSCSIQPGIGAVALNGTLSVFPFADTRFTITATGPGGTTIATADLAVHAPPQVSISASPTSLLYGDPTTLSWTSVNANTCTITPGIGGVAPQGSAVVNPAATTTYAITASGSGGAVTAKVLVRVGQTAVSAQPEGSFGERYFDLIPPDSGHAAYDPKRFAVITGLVHGPDGDPLAGVSVTILQHSDYGTAATGPEGRFTLPVEGGGVLTVEYEKTGYLPVQRQVEVPWNDVAVAETCSMIGLDRFTDIAFDGDPQTVLIHQSTPVTDAFGTRSCTLVFSGDNRAHAIDGNGNPVVLDTIRVHATEYTTPASMPAELPPTSGFTYCVEFTVDGYEHVTFEKPVDVWVDNFLGFPMGEVVPVGYYDREEGVWRCDSGNGVVATQGGSATFMHFSVSHFSPCDANWNRSSPDTSRNNSGTPQCVDCTKRPGDKDCWHPFNSAVSDRTRIFAEDISIPGTGLSLHYQSDRVAGHKRVIRVPASGDAVPADVKRIEVAVAIAGQWLEHTILPPNLTQQVVEFEWDGLDCVGRPVQGTVWAQTRVDYVYDTVYQSAPPGANAFGQIGGDPTTVPAREEFVSRKGDNILVDPVEVGEGTLAEGWTLSRHHHLSSVDTTTLYKGDGTVLKNGHGIIDTAAGNGSFVYNGENMPATQAGFVAASIAVDVQGNYYIADCTPYNFNGQPSFRVRKVGQAGTIATVAGNGLQGATGDQGLALNAQIAPAGVAVDAQGNLYIANTVVNYIGQVTDSRIRQVDPSGVIHTIVNASGVPGSWTDGQDARQARIDGAGFLTLDRAGNLYFWDRGNSRIAKVNTCGLITTYAGNGTTGYAGDGARATRTGLSCWGMDFDAQGDLYVAAYAFARILKIDTSGIVTTVAGTGVGGDDFPAEGPALERNIPYPMGLALDASGNIFFANWSAYGGVFKVDTSGNLSTAAGHSEQYFGYAGDGGPATQALLCYPRDLAFNSAGDLYVNDYANGRIRKVSGGRLSAYAGVVSPDEVLFAEDSGVGHVIHTSGRHRRTIDLDTGKTLLTFSYDSNERLAHIDDSVGNRVTLERNAAGVPTAIVSPDGVSTALYVGQNNQLVRVAYPDGGHYDFHYDDGGLMTTMIDPNGNRFDHEFDAQGYVQHIRDPEGGHWEYRRLPNQGGDVFSDVRSAEDNFISYLDHFESSGAYASAIADSTGGITQYAASSDGLTITKSLPCGLDLAFSYAGDAERRTRYVREVRETTQAYLERVTEVERAYEDTNNDGVPEIITQTVTENPDWESRQVTTVHDTTQSTVTQTTLLGRNTTLTYEPDVLLPVQIEIPKLHDTTFGYYTSDRWRLESVTTGARTVSFTYDAQGNVATVTDPLQRTTGYQYDTVGRVTEVRRPDNHTVVFAYDANGNMTMLTTPTVADHGFAYNGVNANTGYTPPISGAYAYEYDRDRRLTATRFPSGARIENTFASGNLTQVQVLDTQGIPQETVRLAYADCGGKVTSVTNGIETLTYGYDGPLVTSVANTGVLTADFACAYDDHFGASEFTWIDNTGAVQADWIYSYDADGLLTGAGDFTIARDPDNGMPTAVSDTASGGAYELSQAFNGYGEVVGQTSTIHGDPVYSFALGRNDAGQITANTETIAGGANAYAYAYDPLGRLTTVTDNGAAVESYTYDANGNRLTETNTRRGIFGRTFASDAEDRLLSVTTNGDTTYYTYDADGFLTAKIQGSDVTEYRYTTPGELTRVTLHAGTSNEQVVTYQYDPLGRRISKAIGGVPVETYLWHGGSLLAVYDGAGQLVERFEGARLTRDRTTYYMVGDPAGSLRAVVGADGTVVKQIDYDAFGNVLRDTAPAFNVPLAFAGGFYDPDTGLVRFGARDYDPDLGRWTAKDPIGFAGGDTNLYGYCVNDPINFADPSGLNWVDTSLYMAANFSAGMGDTISLGLTGWLRGKLYDDPTNPCSGSYGAGRAAGVAHGFLLGGLSSFASGSASAAARAAGEAALTPYELGRMGEAAAGIVKNTERLTAAGLEAKYRIPDAVTKAALIEVKNVAQLGMSSQIRDYLTLAEIEGQKLELVTRQTTELSAPLQAMIDAGKITVRYLPW